MIRYEFSTGEVFTLDDLSQWANIVALAPISFQESKFVLGELQKLRHRVISHRQFLRATGMPPHVNCVVTETHSLCHCS